MSLQYIDKDIEDMTIEELRRERRMHIWLADRFVHMQFALYKRWEFQQPLKEGVTKEKVAEQYINGIIDEEKYNKLMMTVPMWEAKKVADLQARQDKLDYLSILIFEERALVAAIDDRIEKLGYNRPKKRGRPKKRKYTNPGYDPRKRISSSNQRKPKGDDCEDAGEVQ